MSAPRSAAARARQVLRAFIRLLTFRSTREELLALDGSHGGAGLVATWLVGVARYWDNPHATWIQSAGLQSLLYLGALSFFLWLVYLPLAPEAWSFPRVATFLSLLAPPAILQAVPLDRFLDSSEARELGAWVLLLIVTWRASLWCWFLVRAARLRPLDATISVLLPLHVIVVALAFFDVHHAIARKVNYWRSLDVLGLWAFLLLPVPLCGYLAVVGFRLIERLRERRGKVR